MTLPSGSSLVRVAGLLVFLAGSAAPVSADWLFSPFVGGTFAGSSVLPDLEQGASSAQFVFGGSAGWWTPGILGLEGEFSFAPSFFQSSSEIFSNSNVITLGLSVVITTPVSVTRESLRPYVIGGVGLMQASIDESLGVFPELYGRAQNSLGMNVGGGVVGFLTPRTGVRFELRQFRSLERDESPLTGERGTLLSFWRFTAGVVLRR